ncbi:BRO family protein [Desulfofundulus thermosubterraneus]|uniref:BRO family, N-terminal domain n=1 Tax=Desulfofundulus thermosubterraneus DSM 16057 TaxID=1121432 RepID=A0A1M6KJU1_9FIRM|nr:BRO family protein [Desulfofundulus thermosubterraneus]SHJ59222.1 BRO family, N-terminal domain [Desulfofundulus thermosubterraneus DSM 16057]
MDRARSIFRRKVGVVMENVLPVLAERSEVRIVEVDGQPVVTARDLARALGYQKERAILNLVNRNKESFTDRDTFVIKLMTNPQGGDPYVRVFTKRGALKVCMKSNQPRAVMVQEILIDLYEAVERGNLVPVQQLSQLIVQQGQVVAQSLQLMQAVQKEIRGQGQLLSAMQGQMEVVVQAVVTLLQRAAAARCTIPVPEAGPGEDLRVTLQVKRQKSAKSGRRSVSKLEKLGVADLVTRLLGKGYSYQEIGEVLKAQGISVGKSSIARFAKNRILDGFGPGVI